MDSQDHADQAARLLKHYIAMLFEKVGLQWNSDNNVEIEDIVYHIVEASK